MEFNKLPNNRKAHFYRNEFKEWKESALVTFGYLPIFQPFKETFLLRNLSGNSLRLYIYLGLMSGNKTGETWVSIDTIADYFGKSKRSISTWIKELEKEHLIDRMQLENNGVAHTFLRPYGGSHKKDINSLQKGQLNKDQ